MNRICKSMVTASLSILFVTSQSGCATDSETTAGGVLGGALGGILAAVECASRGNTSLHNCKSEIGVGVAVGAVAGAYYGKSVENRRKKGENDLALIKRNNDEIKKKNALLKAENQTAQKTIDKLRAEAASIKRQTISSAAKEKAFASTATLAAKKQEELQESIAASKEELKFQEEYLASVDASKELPGSEKAVLRKEIASLKSQINTLVEADLELASISSTSF